MLALHKANGTEAQRTPERIDAFIQNLDMSCDVCKALAHLHDPRTDGETFGTLCCAVLRDGVEAGGEDVDALANVANVGTELLTGAFGRLRNLLLEFGGGLGEVLLEVGGGLVNLGRCGGQSSVGWKANPSQPGREGRPCERNTHRRV